jgi:4-hydroxy-tetrahydrodipicolinate synthase
MFDAYRAGQVEEAAAIHASLMPLIEALFTTSSPIPVKWAMQQVGFRVGACRLPLDGMPASLADRLRPLLAPYLSQPVSR